MGKRKVVYFEGAEDYQKNFFGKPIPTRMVQREKEKFAKIFAEGCQPLEELLMEVWKKDYATLGCCKGHELPESYLKITKHKIKRMTAEEYHARQQGHWFQKPRGYVRAPEYAEPYLTIHQISKQEIERIKGFLVENVKFPEKIQIMQGEEFIRISFQNQYQAKSKKIDNTECWKSILEVVRLYLKTKKISWVQQIKNIEETTYLGEEKKEKKGEKEENTRE